MTYWDGLNVDGTGPAAPPPPTPAAPAPAPAGRYIIPSSGPGVPGCGLCDGAGWITADVDEDAPGPRGTTTTRTVTRAVPCPCRATGRPLAPLDAPPVAVTLARLRARRESRPL